MNDELDFQEGEALLDRLTEAINEDERRVMVANIPRIRQMSAVYAALQKLTAEIPGAELEYHLNEPYKSTGYISLKGTNLVFEDRDLFTTAVLMASNVDFYPKIDGTVQINFTFHGIARGLIQ